MKDAYKSVKGIHNLLDGFSKDVAFSAMVTQLPALEREFIRLNASYLKFYLQNNIKDIQYSDSLHFFWQGQTYETVYADALSNKTLCVIITKTNPRPVLMKPKRQKLSHKTIGKYTSVEIRVDKELEAYADVIYESIVSTLLACYSWLGEYLVRHIREFESKLSYEAYSFIRRTLTSINKEYLYDNIWLAVVDNTTNKGYHIADADRAKKAIEKFREASAYTFFSAGELFALFYATQIESNSSFAVNTLNVGQDNQYQLKDAKYREDEPGLLFSEVKAYGESFGQYPLVKEGSLSLVATYNIKYQDEIKEFFDAWQSDVERKFKETRAEISPVIEVIKEHGSGFSLSAEFGKFMGAFASTYHPH